MTRLSVSLHHHPLLFHSFARLWLLFVLLFCSSVCFEGGATCAPSLCCISRASQVFSCCPCQWNKGPLTFFLQQIRVDCNNERTVQHSFGKRRGAGGSSSQAGDSRSPYCPQSQKVPTERGLKKDKQDSHSLVNGVSKMDHSKTIWLQTTSLITHNTCIDKLIV